ncbi:MAG TPA: rod-binding protein [Oligoflexia bacterium]|nr:rod-binding protein [Oligoflexia bacterium]HMP49783.1 rod-binding protein [Oligoflexia bacterium]
MSTVKSVDMPLNSVQLEQLPKAEGLKNRKLTTAADVEKAGSGFEALLLHNMLKEMWSSTGSEGLLGENSNESRIFRDMFNQAVADEVAKGEGIGVKKFLKKELTKYQVAASNK